MDALLNTIEQLAAEEPAGNLRTIADQAKHYVIEGRMNFAERLLCLLHERSTIDWAPALYEFIVATA